MAKAIAEVRYESQVHTLEVDEATRVVTERIGPTLASLLHGSGWGFVGESEFLGGKTDVTDVARLIVTSSAGLVIDYCLSRGQEHEGNIFGESGHRISGFSVITFSHQG